MLTWKYYIILYYKKEISKNAHNSKNLDNLEGWTTVASQWLEEKYNSKYLFLYKNSKLDQTGLCNKSEEMEDMTCLAKLSIKYK